MSDDPNLHVQGNNWQRPVKVQRENGLGEIFTRVPKDTGSGSLKARISKYVGLLTREVLPQN